MDAQKLKPIFKERVEAWSSKLDMAFTQISVRPMRRKWASCSTNGYLNFNAELLEMDSDVWDYVIVHELLHIQIPNHGKLWKSLMRAHLGDWEKVAKRLKG
jgi:predicted metal-dependent hydrolase